jgi:hypothetical protein
MAEAARVRRRKCHAYGRIVLSPSSIFSDIGIASYLREAAANLIAPGVASELGGL